MAVWSAGAYPRASYKPWRTPAIAPIHVTNCAMHGPCLQRGNASGLSHSCSWVNQAARRTRLKAQSGASAAHTRSAVAVLPGFLSAGSQYAGMCAHLQRLGHPAAARRPYGTAQGGQHLYLHPMVGVSAGGWLARLALGDKPYEGTTYHLAPLVSTLVTLGTPHQSLEAYPFGRAQEKWLLASEGMLPSPMGDTTASATTTSLVSPQQQQQQQQLSQSVSPRQLGGSSLSKINAPPTAPAVVQRPETSLQYTNAVYPDATAVSPTRVVSVIGEAYEGKDMSWHEYAATVLQGQASVPAAAGMLFAASSYKANCGRVEGVRGDGVCPLETAALPGAELVVLPDVWHTPGGGRMWYGSRAAVEQWDVLLP